MDGPVLVANRGEVAVRVLRACRLLGLPTVAVYSDADAGAPHVRMADTAVRLGPAPARESYLDAGRIVDAALAHGARWVHPGYGLLSEDAGFAAAVTAAGLGWVGPPAAVVARLGDKVAARAAARACGVTVSAGTADPVDAEHAGAEATRIGFPLLVKAAHGGGGRGMRLVRAPDELAEALAAAGREAAASSGRPEVFLERLVEHARHVEVQVLADHHGAVAVLGDRDCTVQRRHQKLLEEAPAPDLPDALRAAMHDDARRLVRSVGYRGAGTVEFLVDRSRAGAVFLEMNTRLQVEHGVTELVTGVDLVVAQLLVAAGEPLAAALGTGALGTGDVAVATTGHAIQARIAAEDPATGFRPAPGRITRLELPSGPWVRCDVGYGAGDEVSGAYDSLLGKVHAWAPDRDGARARLRAALGELVVEGVPTTAAFLREVLDEPGFAAVAHDTGSVERDWTALTGAAAVDADPVAAGPVAAGPAGDVRVVEIATDAGPLTLRVPGRTRPGTAWPTRARAQQVTGGGGEGGDPGLRAPMDATVVAVPVSTGMRIEAGQVLVVLEAMKMELPVCATSAGEVTAVRIAPGDGVTAGTVLVAMASP